MGSPHNLAWQGGYFFVPFLSISSSVIDSSDIPSVDTSPTVSVVTSVVASVVASVGSDNSSADAISSWSCFEDNSNQLIKKREINLDFSNSTIT